MTEPQNIVRQKLSRRYLNLLRIVATSIAGLGAIGIASWGAWPSAAALGREEFRMVYLYGIHLGAFSVTFYGVPFVILTGIFFKVSESRRKIVRSLTDAVVYTVAAIPILTLLGSIASGAQSLCYLDFDAHCGSFTWISPIGELSAWFRF